MRVQYPKLWEKGRWNFLFSIQRDYLTRQPGWRLVSLGVMKLLEWPEDGCEVTSAEHRGFFFQLMYWLPFELRRW